MSLLSQHTCRHLCPCFTAVHWTWFTHYESPVSTGGDTISRFHLKAFIHSNFREKKFNFYNWKKVVIQIKLSTEINKQLWLTSVHPCCNRSWQKWTTWIRSTTSEWNKLTIRNKGQREAPQSKWKAGNELNEPMSALRECAAHCSSVCPPPSTVPFKHLSQHL